MTTESTKSLACHGTDMVGSKPVTAKSSITLTREQVDQISACIRAVQRAVEEVVQTWRQVSEASEVLEMQHPSPGDRPTPAPMEPAQPASPEQHSSWIRRLCTQPAADSHFVLNQSEQVYSIR